MTVEGVRFETTGAVAVLTLDRPARRNAIDFESCNALRTFLQRADADHTVRAIVLAGNERDFCTGADITAGPDAAKDLAPLDYRYLTVDYQRLFQQLWETETPVVSAVTGTVAGAGWMLALLADLVVAAEGARWTHVFTPARHGPACRRPVLPPAGHSVPPPQRDRHAQRTGDVGDAGVVGRCEPLRPGR